VREELLAVLERGELVLGVEEVDFVACAATHDGDGVGAEEMDFVVGEGVVFEAETAAGDWGLVGQWMLMGFCDRWRGENDGVRGAYFDA